MKNVIIIASKEIREGLRNRWVLATTLLLGALALTLSFLGSAPTGNVGTDQLDVVIVSLSSLTIFLVPLIALLLSHDAIVGEMERGTMLLLLSYPVGRNQVILGKFLGHIAILSFATLLGYGAAAVALAATGAKIDAASWSAFAAMLASSILLGGVFVAIGYFVSALAGERSTAGGIAIGVWLFFVLIYDMALLGTLVAAGGHALPTGLLDALLLINPTDAYRLLNLGSGSAGALSGMGGVAEHSMLGTTTLLTALAFWTAGPLALAAMTFSRREL
ncbi:ABC transporter permease [Rhizobium ruizarguesonis]|uniref:ABC transporter permease n=1 Tax=Rhizobium leguminosarum TaxID=384 RepID=UPI00103884DD|nr:ABC transporter permease [Rhizobium leguminosarum]MBY5494343.1 ABC transporter permease [Rhizobium leguminosarum]TBZ40377.1 ABC transporter permease [Rhizobium leguminosarum bv. viciae]TCA08895.1 ABC transporter permease [Rhizobium leguminosarum bv. viciae]TCA19561.1 ABC transporter permease [Rhizobium leguminosarum bv. viciae]